MNGISCVFISGIGLVTISEISTFPLGFTLYVDKPENYKPEGVDLTVFADFGYNEECKAEIIIPKLETNNFFSGDYRSKQEILDCIEASKKWEEF